MPKFDPIKNFPFWCHKIIPLVYDESLSYYEFLCKVMQKLNEVIDLLNEHSAEIERFEQDILAQFEAFRTEIRNRITEFENLFAEPYDETKHYVVGDITLEDGTLYRAISNTTGEFDPTKWVSIIFATDFAEWRRSLNEEVIQFMTNVTNKINAWLNNIASDYDSTHQYHEGDIVKENDMLFIANTDTTGTFDVSDWDTLVLCDWLVDIIRRFDEAFDSLDDTVTGLEKRKAEITACNVVSKNWVSVAGQTGYTGYNTCVGNVAPTMGNVLVMVITLHVNDPTKMQDVIDCLYSISIGTDATPASASEQEIEWIGESGYVVFTDIVGVNLKAYLHYISSTPYSFNYRITSYIINGESTSRTIPTENNVGMGFIDINNLALYLKGEARRALTAAGEAQSTANGALAVATKARDTKAEKYVPLVIEGIEPDYSSNIQKWSGETTTTTGDTYYYHEITDLIWTGKLLTITLFNTTKPYAIGHGTDADTALSNAVPFRDIAVRYTSSDVYVPCDCIMPLQSDKVFVYYDSSDVDPQDGVSSTAIVTVSNVSTGGTANGFFSDLPTAIICDWLDNRISATEAQLGGYTIMVVTQSYYDGLNPPDNNTIYITH